MKCLSSFIAVTWFLLLTHTVYCDDTYERVSGLLHSEDAEYVDPHSFYYDRQLQKISMPKSNNKEDANAIEIRDQEKHHHMHCKDGPYEVFARRLINILLKKAYFKVNDDMTVGKVELKATLDEFEILKGFGGGKISIRELDGIINDVVQAPELNLFDEAVSYADRMSFYLYEHRIMFGSILVTILIIVMALKVKWTRWRIILVIFDVMIIISFMLTWWELIQESEIKLAAQRYVYYEMPAECRQKDISFFQSVALFFGWGQGDCLKYYEAIMTDPVLKVTPIQAFIHMCNKVFFYPLSMFGKYSGEFIDNITAILPVIFQPFVKILLIMLMPVLFFVLIFILLGGAFGIKIGPMFHFYLHGRQSTPPSNSLDYNNRQTIEVIQNEVKEVPNIAPSIPQESNVTQKTETPKTAEKSTQIKEIEDKKPEKQEESDTNSDEFLEDNEYEKISKERLENEMNRSKCVEEIKHETPQEEKKEGNKKKRNKRSLEIGSGDS